MQRWPGRPVSKLAQNSNQATPANKRNNFSNDGFLGQDVKLPNGLKLMFNEEIEMSQQQKIKSQIKHARDNSLDYVTEKQSVQQYKQFKVNSKFEGNQEDIVIRNLIRNKERRELKQLKEDENKVPRTSSS